MRRLWRILVSPKTTLIELILLAELLLLRVVLPQSASLGPAAFVDVAFRSPVNHFFLVTLGLGDIPTSPIFLGVLGAFFATLVCVIVDRAPRILRRARVGPPDEDRLQAWIAKSGVEPVAIERPLEMAHVLAVLRELGYRALPRGRHAAWAIKHPRAPLGTLAFHASFLLMCTGATTLYYTRGVETAALAEGQRLSEAQTTLIRRAPLAEAALQLDFVVERIDPALVAGQPVRLDATLRFRDAGLSVPQSVGVNRPAAWGATRVLIERAGVAPVLQLQDAQGYIRDRLTLIAADNTDTPPRVPLADGSLAVSVEPIPMGPRFPSREALATTPLELTVWSGDERVFSGSVRPGEHVAVAGGYLRLDEVRYWALLRIVSERGGGILVMGFLLAILGLVWRLVWYRREVAVIADAQASAIRVVGRSEFNQRAFAGEVAAIAQRLRASAAAPLNEVPERP